tara:strand:- start:541 stop:714 length:174 start_codon:yes stop_codon:yes gene_type:complete
MPIHELQFLVKIQVQMKQLQARLKIEIRHKMDLFKQIQSLKKELNQIKNISKKSVGT